MSTTRSTSADVSGPLISRSRVDDDPVSSRSSSCANDGSRCPVNAGENQDPASSAVTCSPARTATSPVPSVVRSTVWSCSTTGTPSAVVCTSTSTYSAPVRIPAATAASVFSGATEE